MHLFSIPLFLLLHIAIVYGQGHIQTFDGKHHRMCAEGDFLLMKSTVPNADVVTVQGRLYKNVFPTIVGK